jgi:hypothetical protein
LSGPRLALPELEAAARVPHAARVQNDDATSSAGAAPAARRPTPWSAVVAGIAVFVASGLFLLSLDLERPAPKSDADKPKILGLNDDATRRVERREAAPRPRAIHCAAGGEATSCASPNVAWCDPDGPVLACCPAGLVASPTKKCLCPAGGTTAPTVDAEGRSCELAKVSPSTADKLAAKRSSLQLCYDSAKRRGPIENVELRFVVTADGIPDRIEVKMDAPIDATFQDCVTGFIEEVRFSPPADGWRQERLPWP